MSTDCQLPTFRTTATRNLCDRLRVVVNNLIELLDDLHLLLHLPLKLVQAFQDLLHVDAHLIELLAMTVSTNPGLIDLIVVGLEYATNLLGNCRQVALQSIPLRC